MAELQGTAVVVTGSSKGIGYGIAQALAEAGADVAVSARSDAEVAAAVERLRRVGAGRVIGARCDVRDTAEVERLIGRAVEAFGGLDVLVNNAGVGEFAPAGELDVEVWDRVIDTNLSGTFYASHAAIPHLRERGGGWIINIASLAGKSAIAGGAAYNASKFGVVGLSEAMMLDLRHDDIRVVAVLPGSVNTHFGDRAPSDENAWMLQPEDVARVVLDLLRFPPRALPSRIEIRPTAPPRKD